MKFFISTFRKNNDYTIIETNCYRDTHKNAIFSRTKKVGHIFIYDTKGLIPRIQRRKIRERQPRERESMGSVHAKSFTTDSRAHKNFNFSTVISRPCGTPLFRRVFPAFPRDLAHAALPAIYIFPGA